MKIPMALLADEANVSQEGKLNVLGVFDRIAAAGFPTVHPKMVFVFRVQAEYADAGRELPGAGAADGRGRRDALRRQRRPAAARRGAGGVRHGQPALHPGGDALPARRGATSSW